MGGIQKLKGSIHNLPNMCCRFHFQLICLEITRNEKVESFKESIAIIRLWLYISHRIRESYLRLFLQATIWGLKMNYSLLLITLQSYYTTMQKVLFLLWDVRLRYFHFYFYYYFTSCSSMIWWQ